ncbi:MAG: DegV family protein [Anaerolineales bacterium]|nr:DegV family protein [Anaerolineales bacterium]
MKISILTDSTADLAASWVAQYNIRVVPVYVNFGDESFVDDGVALPRSEFYARLAHAPELPTTAAPPPGIVEEAYRDLLRDADHVVTITVAADLSGVHNSMALAANNVAPDKITVLDSGTLSMGLGWQVIAAAEAAHKGADLAAVLEAARRARQKGQVYAALDTFEFLRKGGRVSWIKAGLGSLLQIKPIVAVKDGKVEPAGRVRTFKKAFDEMVKLAHTQVPLERLAVLHSNAPDRAEQLRQALVDIAPAEDVVIADVTTAIGTHVGPGGIGLAMVTAG